MFQKANSGSGGRGLRIKVGGSGGQVVIESELNWCWVRGMGQGGVRGLWFKGSGYLETEGLLMQSRSKMQ